MRNSTYNPKLATDMVKDRAYCLFITASGCGYFAQTILNCSAKERSRFVHFGPGTHSVSPVLPGTNQSLSMQKQNDTLMFCGVEILYFSMRDDLFVS